jgi:hypothetical protein
MLAASTTAAWDYVTQVPDVQPRPGAGLLSEMAFYEKVIKVKADVAAFLS